jgi:hypothetical protein
MVPGSSGSLAVDRPWLYDPGSGAEGRDRAVDFVDG